MACRFTILHGTFKSALVRKSTMTSAENSLFSEPAGKSILNKPICFRFSRCSVGVFQREEHREEDEDGRLIRAHWKDDPPSFNKN